MTKLACSSDDFCLQSASDRAQTYLADTAFPFWSEVGAYDNGCFVERLNDVGEPEDPGFTRTRVQARQIYAFSHAEWNGTFVKPDFSARAVDFFLKSAWMGADNGWARTITRKGDLVDPTTDLYNSAFALFALAWRYRVAKDARCLEIAHQTIDHLHRTLRHPNGGYWNDATRALPRQQNPHMHLLEASCEWASASGDSRFLELAETIVRLFETRFYDSNTRSLGEFFNEDWSSDDLAAGQIVEPGHHFEWAWIIGVHGRLSGRFRNELIANLIDFARRHGLDELSALTIDQVDRRGRPLAFSLRLWPQTEALKACVVEAERLEIVVPGRVDRILNAIFARFLEPGPLPGTWRDHYERNWTLKTKGVPASSLYHITLAFFEIIRARNSLKCAGRALA